MTRHKWDPIAAPITLTPPRRVGDGLTPAQARSAGWVRTGSSLYVPTSVDRSVAQQRIIEVAAKMPPYAVITGWAACLLHGAAWFDGLGRDGRTPLPVGVGLGARGAMRRNRGVALSFERMPEAEVTQRYGVRVAIPERAVIDQMRRHREREALVALESALAGQITSLPKVEDFAATHRGLRRSEVVTWAIARARGGARSPLEVRVRAIAEEDAGWPRLVVNRVVLRSDGLRIGEVDLVDVEAGGAIEVDGAEHRSAEQQEWDISKEEALRSAGMEVTRVTGRQLRHPASLTARLIAVRQRALARPATQRAWLLAPSR